MLMKLPGLEVIEPGFKILRSDLLWQGQDGSLQTVWQGVVTPEKGK
jgi:hypothetical protein